LAIVHQFSALALTNSKSLDELFLREQCSRENFTMWEVLEEFEQRSFARCVTWSVK
jgi:hypothetical protein